MNIAARSRVVAVGFLHIEPKNLTDLYRLQEIGMHVGACRRPGLPEPPFQIFQLAVTIPQLTRLQDARQWLKRARRTDMRMLPAMYGRPTCLAG